MSDCTNNVCLDQLLEPDPQDNFTVVNSNGSLAFFESGGVNLPVGGTELTIAFTVQKINADYTFNELAVQNVTDPSPFEIGPSVISRTRTGFTVLLDTIPDTANYLLRWEVAVTNI